MSSRRAISSRLESASTASALTRGDLSELSTRRAVIGDSSGATSFRSATVPEVSNVRRTRYSRSYRDGYHDDHYHSGHHHHHRHRHRHHHHGYYWPFYLSSYYYSPYYYDHYGFGLGFGLSFGYPYHGVSFGVSYGYPYVSSYGYYGHGYPYYGYRFRYRRHYGYYSSYYPLAYRTAYVTYPYYPSYAEYYSYENDPAYGGGTYVDQSNHYYYYGQRAGDATSVEEVPEDGLYESSEAGAEVEEARFVVREPLVDGTPAANEPNGELSTAQYQFSLGYLQLERGEYQSASEHFYEASLEAPESRLLKLFLALSLAGQGEYGFSAEYLRHALEDWDALALYPWDVSTLLPEGETTRRIESLRGEVALGGGGVDALLVLAFLEFHSRDPGAGATLDHLRDFGAASPVDRAIAERYLSALLVRDGEAVPVIAGEISDIYESPVAEFLAAPSAEKVSELPIH